MESGPNTSAEGAAVGAAIGAILVWIAEVSIKLDVPTAVEGAILVVATYVVARLLPPR